MTENMGSGAVDVTTEAIFSMFIVYAGVQFHSLNYNASVRALKRDSVTRIVCANCL